MACSLREIVTLQDAETGALQGKPKGRSGAEDIVRIFGCGCKLTIDIAARKIGFLSDRAGGILRRPRNKALGIALTKPS